MPSPTREVSETLDVISIEPGAILYRGPEAWQALSPGNPGDILVINSAGLPEWQAPF